MADCFEIHEPDGNAAAPGGGLAGVAALGARLLAQIQPADAITAILAWRAAAQTERLDSLAVYNAAMTARRVRYARVDRENQRWAEVIATAHGLPDDPTQAVRRLRQTPEGLDWLIREWELIRAEVDAGLHPAPKAVSVHDRARMFLGLHVVEQDGGEWAEQCKDMVRASWDRKPEPERAHRDWVAAWAADQAEGLRQERSKLDHEAEERDKSEATARALFDPGPDAERMRRHEANAERFLLQAIKELDRIRTKAAKAEATGRGRTQTPAPTPGTSKPNAATQAPTSESLTKNPPVAGEPIVAASPGANEPIAAPDRPATGRPATPPGAGVLDFLAAVPDASASGAGARSNPSSAAPPPR